jgi:hypothetical protein
VNADTGDTDMSHDQQKNETFSLAKEEKTDMVKERVRHSHRQRKKDRKKERKTERKK